MKRHYIIILSVLLSAFCCQVAVAQKQTTPTATKQKTAAAGATAKPKTAATGAAAKPKTTATGATAKPKTAANGAAVVKPVAAPTKEDLVFENLLPATAKVQFVDSVIVPLNSMFGAIPLPSAMGKVYSEKKDSIVNYVYENDFGTRKIMSIAGKDGVHKLYNVNKLGKSWGEPQPIDIPGDYTDLICPFLMQDGQTLYFAAKGGEDNLGGHDVFYTFYDPDDDKYISPQSLGLPYNSRSHDYYYIVDETNNLGYLLSQRKMQKGQVCLYTFIPTETRETYVDDSSIDNTHLKKLAEIQSIAASQTNKKEVQEARDRLTKVKTKNNKSSVAKIEFVVKGNVVYHSLAEFKSSTNKDMYQRVLEMKKKLNADEEKLANLRKAYHNGSRSNKNEILKLEESVQKQRIDVNSLEKEVRNNEIKLIK